MRSIECRLFTTGPPTHSVGASIVLHSDVCRRRLSSSVTFQYNVTLQGVARDSGPVVLRPVRAIPCYTVASTALFG